MKKRSLQENNGPQNAKTCIEGCREPRMPSRAFDLLLIPATPAPMETTHVTH